MNSKNIKQSVEILLVEDNPGDIFLIKEVLSESSLAINLTVTKDGADAMDFLNREGDYKDALIPSLVILDLNLPKKNGKEVLKEIRNNGELKDIPVIIFTSSDAEDDILICQYLNVIKYYRKPIDFDEYIETVKFIEDSLTKIINQESN